MGRSQSLGVLNKLYGDRGRNVVHRVPRFGASKMRVARFPGRAARSISLSADFHLALARSRIHFPKLVQPEPDYSAPTVHRFLKL